MVELYDFFAGPAAWAAFIFCIGGLLLRIGRLFGSSRERKRILSDGAGLEPSPRTGFSLVWPKWPPPGFQAVLWVAGLVFHLCLLAVPIFLLAHGILLQESLGVSLLHFPEAVSDSMTLIFIIASLFVLLSRIIRPEIRVRAKVLDCIFLVITVLPFVTGFLAYHQVGNYSLFIVLHVLSAEVLIVMIPFSRLGHAASLFFFRVFTALGSRLRGGEPVG